jgi:outer membrane protein assembly factor BamB
MLAVISAPLLWPVAAILQLLFPVLLREQFRAYRWACVALVTDSFLLTVHWLLGRLWPDWVATHVPPGNVTSTLVAVVAACTVAAWWERAGPIAAPLRWEWIAFAILLIIFGGRGVYLAWRGRFEFDHGSALGVAAAGGLLHLALRQLSPRWPILTTQRIFLTAFCVGAVVAALHQGTTSPNRSDDPTGEWPTFRGNNQRTGAIDADDSGPAEPRIVWRFRLPQPGDLHASPAAAGETIVFAAAHATPARDRMFSRLYCVHGRSGKLSQSIDLPRAGISSPAVHGSLVALGEGFHEDRECRLRVVDRQTGTVVGSFATTSHVESSPALDGTRAYFGAGDDGIYAVELGDGRSPRQLWHVEGYHVDAGPLVAGETVYVGSVEGDRQGDLCLLALDAASGAVRWKRRVTLPAIAAPAIDGGRVFFTLSNGKLNRDADKPAGAVYCADARTGERLWEVATSAGLYASPVCRAGHVFVVAGDGICQCLRQSDGGVVWNTPLGQRVVASPIVGRGAMLVLTERGLLAMLDTASGRILWRFDGLEEYVTGGSVYASPILVRGRVYVCAGGHLFCIGDRREREAGTEPR